MTTKTAATYTWQPQANGDMIASDGRASLVKRARLNKARAGAGGKRYPHATRPHRWFLVLRDGREFDLGPKASFATAERIMTRERAC